MTHIDKPDCICRGTDSDAANDPVSVNSFSLSENRWRALIIAGTAFVLLFSIYCLSNGITTIFMHLYYFPIILLAYRYRMKGAVLATLLAVAYVTLVIIYDYGQDEVIAGAFYRFIIFVAIGAVVGALSDRLFRIQISLKESAAIRERYISLAPAIILVLDAEGKISHLNRHGCTLLGCTIGQVQGKPWIDTFIREDARDTVRQVFRSLISGEVEPSPEFNNEVISMDGAVRTIHWHNTVLTDESGKITGTLSYGEDITENKRREEMIHTLQQFQEGIITNANVWIMVLSPKGKILEWNNAAETISGYSKEETLGTVSIWKLLYPDPPYRKHVTTEIARVITRDTYLEDFETEIQCRDGSKKTIAWNTKGLRNADGDVENYIAVGRDVTERRKAEDAISASEEKYRTLVERISDVIYSLDERGVITYISPAIEKISGYSPSEIMGKEFRHFIVPDDLQRVREIFEDGKHVSVKSFQFRIVNKPGEERWLRVSSEPVVVNGEFFGINGVMLDITEQKRSEEALLKSRSLLSNAMDLAHMASWEFDVGTNIFTFDDRFYALYGTTAEREGGYRMPVEVYAREFVHPDDMSIVAEEVRKAVEAPDPGYISHIEHRIIRRDGAVRYILVRISITKDSAGRTIRTHGANQDVTERKLAELELIKLASIVEHSGEFIGLSNPDGTVIFLNNAGARMIGVDTKEMISHTLMDFVPEHLVDTVQNDVMPALIQNGAWEGDLQLRNFSTGRLIDVHSMTFTISDPATGAPLYLANISLDITERKQMEEELRKSNAMNLSLFAVIPDIIFILSEKGEFVDFRGGSKAELYVPYDRFLGRNIDELLPRDVVSLVHHKMQEVLDTGVIQAFEYSLEMNGIRHYHARMTRFGQTQFFCIIQDITERKRMEEALQQSEEKYRAYIENALEAIFITDKNGRYLDLNPSACRLVGYTRDELLSFNIADLSGREADLAGFNTLLTKGRVVQEISLKRKDGTVVPVILNAVMLPDGNLMGFCTDITERKRMEEALRESEEKYRAYIENALESIFITDKNGRYLDVNPSACRLVGYTRDELLSFNIRDLADPGDLETALAGFNTLLTKGSVVQEISLKRKDGTLVPVILNAVMLPDGNLMGFCTDITERKMTADALALAGKKLNLLSSITRHDILNQLMVLIGYLDMALEDVRDPVQRKSIEVEMLAAKTIQRQIEFTREYQELGIQAPVWLNINKSLMQAATSLPMRDVRISIDRTDLEVYADRLFEKVFYNLIDNALRYGGDRMTSITVSSHEEEPALVIIFEDNGAGISAGDKPKLFSRGFGKNTGLGLFLSREILAITGISIEETSETGKGARFEITVPKGMYRFTSMNSGDETDTPGPA
jgi:PAS domain S-box